MYNFVHDCTDKKWSINVSLPSSESYDSAFFKRNEIKTRQCVYISREIHRRISRIVSVLAKHELTVGGYIDLILERHLEENQEEINGLLRKEIDDWNV